MIASLKYGPFLGVLILFEALVLRVSEKADHFYVPKPELDEPVGKNPRQKYPYTTLIRKTMFLLFG